MVPMGKQKLAVLTRVFFFTRNCMAVFARRPKKSGGRKAAFTVRI